MRSFATVALLVALNGAVAGAQSASTSSESPSNARVFGKVTGLVFDSLLMQPLAGANVWIPGTSHSALTDARGRFVFDSVATGRQQIAATSSGLDSIGLQDLLVNADVTAGKTIDVKLTSPSRARLWSMLCATRTKLGSDSGIAFGTVHDGESNARLVQAPVTFNWYNLTNGKGKLALGDVSSNVRTDSIGMYYACGLPTDVQLATQAYGNKAQSGEIQYHIGARGLIRLDLVASTEMTDSSARGTATVGGVIVNENRAPVADALVFLSGADTTVRSGADGSFVFRGVPSGTLSLQARKVGSANSSSIVNVRRGEVVQTSVVMSTATNLATVNVAAKSGKSFQMQEFEERQKMGFGMAFDFIKHEPSNPFAPLMTVPRVKVAYLPGGVPFITMSVDGGRRKCLADVYLDGRRSDSETIAMYPVELLAAMEVYNSPYQVPAQYMRTPAEKAKGPEWSAPSRNKVFTSPGKSPIVAKADSLSGSCGVILYWTKAAMRP